MNDMGHKDNLQYLTFRLGQEMYAVTISCIREVLELVSITALPGTDPALRGVINLRGRAVPVMDLRCKLGLPSTEDTVDTCVVIVDLGGNGGAVGALVDAVQEVVDIASESVEPPPAGARGSFLTGMARLGESFVIILDARRLFTSSDALLGGAPDLAA